MSENQSPEPIRVMQVVDTLELGGAERVAANLANLLRPNRFVSYLCTTRRDGPLVNQLAAHVHHFCLHRTGRYDAAGLRRMIQLVTRERIQILHAHGSSLFVARVAAALAHHPILVWHDHYGGADWNQRAAWLYKRAIAGASVIAVNDSLAQWSRDVLQVPADHVWYLPNWVEDDESTELNGPLPGDIGKRVICVANLRAQKDHMTLLRAILSVRKVSPEVHLLLLGQPMESRYADYVLDQIGALGLTSNVSYLGPRLDVMAVLRACDIGVLSSVSEGLPLALLEYGMAGLAVVATDVGQCREVLVNGSAGILVPPSAPEPMAAALIDLLGSPERRAALGKSLQAHVTANYHARPVLARICEIYEGLLQQRVA